jgi:hypothetical protein
MTSNSTDFGVAIERLLRLLGYEICGDDDLGWHWQLGSFKSLTAELPFDTVEIASAAALADLVSHTSELLDACQQTVARWSHGDLALSIRELDLCVRAFHRPG